MPRNSLIIGQLFLYESHDRFGSLADLFGKFSLTTAFEGEAAVLLLISGVSGLMSALEKSGRSDIPISGKTKVRFRPGADVSSISEHAVFHISDELWVEIFASK